MAKPRIKGRANNTDSHYLYSPFDWKNLINLIVLFIKLNSSTLFLELRWWVVHRGCICFGEPIMSWSSAHSRSRNIWSQTFKIVTESISARKTWCQAWSFIYKKTKFDEPISIQSRGSFLVSLTVAVNK